MKCKGSASRISSTSGGSSTSVFKSASFPAVSGCNSRINEGQHGSATNNSRMEPSLTDVYVQSEMDQSNNGLETETDLTESAGVVSVGEKEPANCNSEEVPPVVEETAGCDDGVMTGLVPVEVQPESSPNAGVSDIQAAAIDDANDDGQLALYLDGEEEEEEQGEY
ncbi:hypothetical protein V6N11_038950 [Hibiscus sabdariffa]|uniref:Uncharacterized protein n=1 Tax=Hibiscus sabdariffa TaxID=183260 RepID=A0ABR2SLS8_9ROSI